jgi:sec-independent protein translocase protein TatC
LFLGGVALGYYILPKGLAVLISFVPNNVINLVDYTTYFSFMMRMLLIFGIAMEIPLFVVLLNLAGIISGEAIGKHRPWIVIGTMIFAAVATPSTDPFSMLMLAIPMLVLFALSEIIARISDRVRGRGAHAPSRTDQWADDQASTL